jgi:hypothetical protein
MRWRSVGEWRYSSTILGLGTRWRWVVSFTPRSLYNRWRSRRYLLDRLGGPQSRSGSCGVEKSLLPLPESNPGRPARSLLWGTQETNFSLSLILVVTFPLSYAYRHTTIYKASSGGWRWGCRRKSGCTVRLAPMWEKLWYSYFKRALALNSEIPLIHCETFLNS